VDSQNQVAIVTGGSSGIGQAICLALAGHGYHVVVVGSNQERISQTLAMVSSVAKAGSDGCLGLALNVADDDDMQKMVDETLARFSAIDVLVASAGIGKKPESTHVMPHPTVSLPLDEWQTVLGVNLTGVFLSNRAVLPAMIQRGRGHIINVCSSTTPRGLRGTPYGQAYCASKFGVAAFTQSLATEVESHGVRVQAVFPGAVETKLVARTVLARPFGGAMSAQSFSTAVLRLIQYPGDAIIIDPYLLPFKGGFT
jgi:NAD(P)-dependent dehydrogenase (short-subunit alcohol dehydrogenase family)